MRSTIVRTVRVGAVFCANSARGGSAVRRGRRTRRSVSSGPLAARVRLTSENADAVPGRQAGSAIPMPQSADPEPITTSNPNA